MRRSSSWIAVLPSLVIPVCLGLMMYLALAYSINQGHITNDTVLRYLTGHPVSKVTVGMFFIGLASLLLIATNVFEQFGGEKKITLVEKKSDRQDGNQSETEEETSSPTGRRSSESTTTNTDTVSDQAARLADRLTDLPSRLHNHYLWQRLQSGLQFAVRVNSTEGIEDELKYLADLDLDQQQQRYSLVQILIWATPMLGFLGTVLGISQALGGIDVGPDNNLQTMMDGLRGNLYIAFDTTALALTLSMLLMFAQFLIDRFETQLLLLVDQRTQRELNRCLGFAGATQTGSYQDMAENIVEANRKSTEQQTEIWKKTIRLAEQAWASTLTDTNLQVQDNMSMALDENVANLAHYLGEAIEKADNAMTHRWQQWQVTLSENARLLAASQSKLHEQTELLQNLVPDKSHDTTPAARNMYRPPRYRQETTEAKPNTVAFPVLAPVSNEPKPQPDTSEQETPLEYLPLKSVMGEVHLHGGAAPQADSDTGQPQPDVALPDPDADSTKPNTMASIDFQSYLDDVMERSADHNAKSGSKIGRRGTREEIVLPFRFSAPDKLDTPTATDSDDAPSDEAA